MITFGKVSWRSACLVAVATLAAVNARATTFNLPTDGSTVVGKVVVVSPTPDNTLLDIARHFDVGYEEMASANPHASMWLGAKHVVVPSQFILPPKPWKGVVVNIPQRRLYYFPPEVKGQPKQVITYPVSIAREGWSTPLGPTKIIAKYRDPGWLVPSSIRAEHLKEEGVELPEYVPPGPDNPMGMLAMQTGFPGIFIHATNKPWGVGMRTSHGCIHLYPEDAAQIFPMINKGTPVRIINEPVLVGNDQGRWVMATFEPVKEYQDKRHLADRAKVALKALENQDAQAAVAPVEADPARVARLSKTPQSTPVALSPNQLDLPYWLRTLKIEAYDHPPYGMDANNAKVPGVPVPAEASAPVAEQP
ncbi:L,D-transpeptidase family protein [Crenobacter sp. SG2303]|uniref:L,D-transpeptidase family protein n=1 Tax=Crenobacter oryzisoli TaxID=3056844 RepID=A0ABT7XI37_9NEIS|nr:L,D-transpeptidase family protein [Crenobacter sp. SG2303]MDN0073450.1 L,D-transpeptidase family protein [Crenobacter sp. SG2303]